jgi:hypothetical protein
VAPKNERQNSNRNPAYHFVFSAVSKKKEQKGSAEKDRTPKWIKRNKRKVGVVAKTLKHHFVKVPRDRMQRKQPMLVPRFVAHFGDMKVTKIED